MKLKLILFTVLASVGFFNPHQMLSLPIQKALFLLAIMAGLAVALSDGIQLRGVKYPRRAYAVLMAAMPVSVLMASAFHMQSLSVSIVAFLPAYLAFVYFYILMKMDVDWRSIMKMYLWVLVAATVVYFGNLATFPNNIFGEPIEEDLSRGILRLPLPFQEMFCVGVFYCINRWFDTNKKKWLWIAAWLFLMVILSVVRQLIALTAILSLFFLMRHMSWKIKLAFLAVLASGALIILPQIPMYQAMVELTEAQKENNEETEDIRITSWKYYTYENQTNGLTAILGNGLPSLGNSRWGIMFDAETEDNGCFYADVGWAGFYWLYGIFSVGALLTLVIAAIIKKKPADRQFLTYSFILILISGIASGVQVYHFQIVSISTLLYMTFGNTSTVTEATAPEQKRITSPKHAPLYPQL